MSKILVTGAGGFVGCRLVEILLEHNAEVRAMAHRPSGAVRLARLPVEISWCDITDKEQVAEAVKDCDVIIHCAYGTAGGSRDQTKVTVTGTDNLMQAAVESGVKQFIHLSTIAVYSYNPRAGTTEDSPFGSPSDNYCRDKISAEVAVQKFFQDSRINITVLRMGNIYGPFSGPWTMRPLQHIRQGLPCLIDEGEHASNFVYVDNAVEAILRSINNSQAYNEAFFITDDEKPWRDVYSRYAEWLGETELGSIDRLQLKNSEKEASRKVRNWFQDVGSNFLAPLFQHTAFAAAENRSLGPILSAIWRYVPIQIREKLIGSEFAFIHNARPPMSKESAITDVPLGLLQVYGGTVAFSNKKAKDKLGFVPLTDFETAMKKTEQWARWARLVD